MASEVVSAGKGTVKSVAKFVAGSAAIAASLLALAGCGNNYRAVISAINPVGPAPQPEKLVAVVSDPRGGLPGLLTLVDVPGDTVVNVARLNPAPVYFDMFGAANGGTGYTLHSNASGTTLNNFDVSPQLLSNQVFATSIFSNADANAVVATSTGAYISEPGRSAIGQLQGGSPASLRQEFAVPANPQYIVALSTASRIYAISQGTGSAGTATAIETGTNTISSNIPIGTAPVYGVMTADTKRVFITNRGSNNISVINAQTNALDAAHPSVNVGNAPVWADIAPTLNELVVVNQGNGTTAGSISIVNIALCSNFTAVSNPTCDTVNPVDAADFGTIVATVPVGINPTQVSVLQDGSRAYVMCQNDPLNPDPNNGVVYVVNLTTNTVTARIKVSGHPNWITAVTGTPKGKVYTTASDSRNLTVIDTQTDTFYTTIDLQGFGISVRRNTP